MIRIRILLDDRERPYGFEIRGHAGASAHGTDIVCAGVSTVAQTIMLGLGEVVGAEPDYRHGEGLVRCVVPEVHREREAVRALLDTAVHALRKMAVPYGDFMRIEEKRTKSRSGGGGETAPPHPAARGRAASSSERKSSNAQEDSHD